MSQSPTEVIELTPDRPHVTTDGNEAAPDAIEPAFEMASENEIHRVSITPPLSTALGQSATVIRLLLDDDAGIITYSYGKGPIYRSVPDRQHAVDVFRGTVDTTVDAYNDRDLSFDFEYSPADTPIEFETR